MTTVIFSFTNLSMFKTTTAHRKKFLSTFWLFCLLANVLFHRSYSRTPLAGYELYSVCVLMVLFWAIVALPIEFSDVVFHRR